ncbi:molybdenum cofactor cytidylyltransferase [Flavobacteriaceae bacterium MAR_2010_105]|nr:molybdenum cofactor cytidylyltransferase [Flavobacteriaceae bacterium MAR_2010_105]
MSKIAILILAAGGSSRMGQPKQLLKWGKNSLLGHTIENVLKTNTHEIIVVLGANFNSVKQEIKNYQVTILNNKDWSQGLGTSIAYGVHYLLESSSSVDGVLIVLADQPFVDRDYLEKMMTSFSSSRKQILATAYDDDIQGVPVLFDASYFEELSKLTGDVGAKQCIKRHQLFVKTLVPPVKNVDLDTLEDYEKEYRLKFNN